MHSRVANLHSDNCDSSLRIRVCVCNQRIMCTLGWPTCNGAGGVRARTVVIVTAAPGCDDTEHTLNTLRTACMMAGLEGRPSRDTQVKVSLDDNGDARFPPVCSVTMVMTGPFL